MKIVLPILSVLACLLIACGGNAPKENKPVEEEPKLVLKPAPTFSGDSAYNFVEAQVKFGPRVPNTEPHKRCKDYFYDQLKKFGFSPIIQNFEATAYNGKKLTSYNVIGTYNPQASKRILLAAHWDTRPYNDKEVTDSTKFKPIDGANDGASGVGVLLEIARVIAQAEKKPTVGIDIIFFDSEDYGHPENHTHSSGSAEFWCLGSQYWAKNKHKQDYTAYYGILLDMVGAKGAQFYKEGTSTQYAHEVTNQIWDIAHKLNYSNHFKMANSPSITDDHYFVNTLAKIPMLDIIEYDPAGGDSYFAKYHHTMNDNMDIIDRNTLKAVGQTVLQAIYNEE
jgi:Zn-dependent M28 family amino/carboxypeptidase